MAFSKKLPATLNQSSSSGFPESGGQHLKILNSNRLPKRLSAESMRLLLEKICDGERNMSRSILSLTLNVNDVVAEYCLRHLEERIRDEPLYAESLITKLVDLPQADPREQLQFLRFAFGVHGIVSTAILNHYRALGPVI